MKIIEAGGSFREVGRKIGEATREEVAVMRELTVADLLEAFGQDELRMTRVALGYFERARGLFPEACDYLEGMAEGAGMGLHAVLPIAFCEELDAEAGRLRCRDKCSTLVTRSGTDPGWIVGHNEDFWPEFYGKMSVYDLRFDGWPRLVCLNYPGNVPGLSGSLNEAGLAVTNNSLWPGGAPGGIPKQIMHFRAALSHSVFSALPWLAAGPHALTDHFIVAGGEEDLVISAEFSSHPDALRYMGADHDDVSCAVLRYIVPGPPSEHGQARASFAHTNHVRWLEPWISGVKEDPAHPGSAMRFRELCRIAEEERPRDGDDMLRILMRRDGILNRNEEYNRTGQPKSVTLATVVIAPSSREIAFVTYGDGDERPKTFVL